MKYIKFLIILLSLSTPLFSDGIRLNNWKSYTAMSDAKAVAIDTKGRYWVACNGGAYCFDPADSSYREFRNDNGLLSIELTEVYADTANKNIYFGSTTGNIDVCSEDFVWSNYLDIKNEGFTNATIYSIVARNNKIYIGGGFGLAVFDPKEKIFIEDVKKLGDFSAQTAVKKIIFYKDSIWLATSQGLAVAKMQESIAARSVWKNITKDSTHNLANLVDIYQNQDSLVIASIDGNVHSYKDGKLELLFNTTEKLNGVFFDRGQYIAYSDYQIMSVTTGLPDYSYPWKPKFNKFYSNLENSGNSIVMSYQYNSIVVRKNNQEYNYMPPTPQANEFIVMNVDKTGRLWATGATAFGRGIMLLDSGKWTNITAQEHKDILTNAFTKISPLSDGSVNFAGYGTGILNVKKTSNGFVFDTLTSYNSPFVGFNDGFRFVLVGNSKEDTYGNVWTINARAIDGKPVMHAKTKNGWFSYTNCNGNNRNSYYTLEIDANNTKWLACANPNGGDPSGVEPWGLHFYNERGTFENSNDDVCGTITSSDYENLNNNINSDLKLDKSGYLWIASPNGLSVMLNPSAALSKNPKFIIRQIKVMKDANIRQIMVDALDNKWLATPKGVYVISPDGSELLATYNNENSPLPTNDVYSLATDVNTGDIYIGTTKGLFVASSLSIKPSEDYQLTCYPQPYKPSKDNLFVIDGLTENSDVKITTVGGEYIRSFQTIGRTITWDGKTEKGNSAPTGVYLIIATSKTNGQSAVAKFALVQD